MGHTADEGLTSVLIDDAVRAEFRGRLRAWLPENLPRTPEPDGVEDRFWWRHAWHRTLHRGGWIGVDLPAELGGHGLDALHRAVLIDELTAADAPPIANWVGVELVAPTLVAWGSAEQRAEHVPAILDGGSVWCQAFSEPEAGSDLAAVTTRATPDGDGFVLRGRKRWSSWSRFADQVLVLARTGSTEARHKALSCFIVPLARPGVSVRPVPMLYGDAEESDIVLDDVRVGADALVGELDRGWSVLMTSLSLARGLSTLTRVGALRRALARLISERIESCGSAADLPPTEVMALTDFHARAEALRGLAYRKVADLAADGVPGPVASTEKLLWGELSRQVAEHAVLLGGLDALAPSGGMATGWLLELYRGIGNAIEGGTSEIQRTTIARHVLGLPA
ncbi:acyl-CoA dehydrogenase family protein [Saccharopolyspora sp. NPDC047091]|uniref:acyl-CoA dehydrogenase family protein n=1 Tax=Saccharopolyspora sp. NPDC047091 TaxID=3155924 RepID=UPI0033E9837C